MDRNDDKYVPNEIPLKLRIINVLISAVLIGYGIWGIMRNDLVIPGKRYVHHFRDLPAWFVFTAFICVCLILWADIIDHYDKRNNEESYVSFKQFFKYFGWFMFGLAVFINLIVELPK